MANNRYSNMRRHELWACMQKTVADLSLGVTELKQQLEAWYANGYAFPEGNKEPWVEYLRSVSGPELSVEMLLTYLHKPRVLSYAKGKPKAMQEHLASDPEVDVWTNAGPARMRVSNMPDEVFSRAYGDGGPRPMQEQKSMADAAKKSGEYVGRCAAAKKAMAAIRELSAALKKIDALERSLPHLGAIAKEIQKAEQRQMANA
jgi:hypothetical protein